ncbi:AAA family ATPase [Salinivibrio kushneri]|uniref:AAA family ATPase n=1 Tax=Salinivibrio kushneri TaxID=1908198 RepID=UPI000C82AE55|nr:AAA family ATPase [Salinivibrio kushneri]
MIVKPILFWLKNVRDLALLQDHFGTNHSSPWNDYDYIVKFKLYYVDNSSKQNLGFLRLLVNGQSDTSKFLIENGEEVEKNIYEIDQAINQEIAVSLPLDIDYYHKLNKLLTGSSVDQFLALICDASYFYSRISTYKSWDGFNGSLMREGSSSEAILRKGHQIATGRYSPEESFTINVELDSESYDPVQFVFDNDREVSKTNINLLIGKNGVGKSFLLKELSEIITGVQEIDDKWPYFHKLIVVAYSPFENFHTKDDLLDELDKKYSKKKKIKKPKAPSRRRMNVNEYAYVGFRNESGKFSVDWPKKHSVEALLNILKFDRDNLWWEERGRFEILKETLSLSIDFDNIAVRLLESEKFAIIDGVSNKNIKAIEESSSKEDGLLFIKNNEVLNLSSGQIIYSYMIPSIVSEIEDESLIMLDEPELYLHPHLEVGLIDMMKHLLSETSSYSIIATHSAILTREVEKKAVKILRRKNGRTEISAPGFETYGESLETIIGEVFDDYTTVKPFQNDILRHVNSEEDIESAIKKIGSDVGDEALAYIAAEFSVDEDYLIEDD